MKRGFPSKDIKCKVNSWSSAAYQMSPSDILKEEMCSSGHANRRVLTSKDPGNAALSCGLHYQTSQWRCTGWKMPHADI